MNRKYSIIVPVYNGAKRLEACFDSIKCQTYQNFEVLMINDHSEDESADICQKWAQQDSRFAYYESEMFGVSAARNTGLEHATGEIITFCDDDDELMQDALALVEQIYTQNAHAGIVITGLQKCTPDGEVFQELTCGKDVVYNREELLTALFCNHNIMGSVCNKFFPHRYVEHIRFDEEMEYCEDMLYVVDTFLENRDCKGYISCGITYKYMISQQSATNHAERLFDSKHRLKYMDAFDRMEQRIEEACKQGSFTDRQAKKLLGLIQKKKYIVAAETYCDFELNEWQKQAVVQSMKENRRKMFRYLFCGEPHRTIYLMYRVIKRGR